MARDRATKAAADLKSQQKHYKQVTMKIRRDSGIIEALNTCENATGEAPATYAQRVLREALIRDGYLTETQESET